jgi:hypothetical protein
LSSFHPSIHSIHPPNHSSTPSTPTYNPPSAYLEHPCACNHPAPTLAVDCP